MLTLLEDDIHQSLQKIQQIESLEEIETIKLNLLGKQSALNVALRKISTLPENERPQFGQRVQAAKKSIQDALEQKKNALTQLELMKALKTEHIDVSLPGFGDALGGIHPLTHTRNQLEDLFIRAGFELQTGNEVEAEEINFTALNIPANHPARTLHDTFYLKKYPEYLLRTHTSTVQIHALSRGKAPFRIFSTGAVYRCDSDVTHTPMFHQLEGMVVNENANFSELKGLLTYFLKTFFENPALPIRFRASYFPFTEPSAEVDIQCLLCHGEKCKFCHHSGWLEVLGCGMIHPNVFGYVGIDSTRYQGYAFGIGIERLALLRYRIPDIRLFFENDSRFLSQFN